MPFCDFKGPASSPGCHNPCGCCRISCCAITDLQALSRTTGSLGLETFQSSKSANTFCFVFENILFTLWIFEQHLGRNGQAIKSCREMIPHLSNF